MALTELLRPLMLRNVSPRSRMWKIRLLMSHGIYRVICLVSPVVPADTTIARAINFAGCVAL